MPASPAQADPVDPGLIDPIREASRRLVRALGFLRPGLAGTRLHVSAIHALITLEAEGPMTAARLSGLLGLEKSSISRMLRKLLDAGLLTETPIAADARAKLIAPTPEGERVLGGLHGYARRQVAGALARLRPEQRRTVLEGLDLYATALGADQAAPAPPVICEGYQPGVLGGLVALQARYYAAQHGFGAAFESRIAAGLAEFLPRLDQGPNALWSAWGPQGLLGGLAIDGEDLGEGRAHLRWFILAEGARGAGLGRRLLAEALAFCDARGFAETQLWTFRGLDAARRLYESQGFVLAEEWEGRQWGPAMLEQRFVRPGKTGT